MLFPSGLLSLESAKRHSRLTAGLRLRSLPLPPPNPHSVTAVAERRNRCAFASGSQTRAPLGESAASAASAILAAARPQPECPIPVGAKARFKNRFVREAFIVAQEQKSRWGVPRLFSRCRPWQRDILWPRHRHRLTAVLRVAPSGCLGLSPNLRRVHGGCRKAGSQPPRPLAGS